MREYLYDEGDMNTGFILKSDGTSDFHFCKVESEETVRRILSKCEINFGNYDARIKEITFKHLHRLFRGEKDSWVITQINPRPGELRVEMEIPELAVISEYCLEKYLSAETCDVLFNELGDWYHGNMSLDFSFPDEGSPICFYKRNGQGIVRKYRFYIHSDSDWRKESISLNISKDNASESEKRYCFEWKDEAQKIMVATITEYEYDT